MVKWPKRVRQAGSLEEAKVILWRAVLAAHAGLFKAMELDDHEGVRKYTHCLVQAVGAFGNLTETTDLAKEIEQLKMQLPMRRAI